jgi:5-methyltetrahydrofolate--homocysteine methyltransferase
MTHEEILQGLYDHTLIGNAPEVKDLVNQGLADGLGPESMLYDALIPSLEEVGARFERGDYFVPEMLIAARAMQGALDILRPLLAETGAKPIGTYVMGTVKGDVHDIGKNLVNIMLEGAGFTVYDLGVNVAPETFVQQVQEHQPDIVAALGISGPTGRLSHRFDELGRNLIRRAAQLESVLHGPPSNNLETIAKKGVA